MDSAFEELTPVQESLFLTLYLRALDRRSAAPILGDRTSAELAATVDHDVTRQKVQRSQVRDLALRTKTLDDLVVRSPTGTAMPSSSGAAWTHGWCGVVRRPGSTGTTSTSRR